MLKQITDDLKKIVESGGFQEIKKGNYPDAFSDQLKFFDPIYVERARLVAKNLRVYKQKGLRILDIGSGFGYFPWICQQLGHKVLASDVHNTLYTTVRKYLKVPEAYLEIKPYEKINRPSTLRFDLITALKTSIHNTPNGGKWNSSAWKFFYSDIINHLSSGGALYMSSSNIYDTKRRKCNACLHIKQVRNMDKRWNWQGVFCPAPH